MNFQCINVSLAVTLPLTTLSKHSQRKLIKLFGADLISYLDFMSDVSNIRRSIQSSFSLSAENGYNSFSWGKVKGDGPGGTILEQ